MRLTPDQAQAIRQRIRSHMGAQARIWLFGSRADDGKLGGDVDLYVEPETAPDLTTRLLCQGELADALDLNVDLIVQQPGSVAETRDLDEDTLMDLDAQGQLLAITLEHASTRAQLSSCSFDRVAA